MDQFRIIKTISIYVRFSMINRYDVARPCNTLSCLQQNAADNAAKVAGNAARQYAHSAGAVNPGSVLVRPTPPKFDRTGFPTFGLGEKKSGALFSTLSPCSTAQPREQHTTEASHSRKILNTHDGGYLKML